MNRRKVKMSKKEILKLLKYLDSYYEKNFELPTEEDDLDIKVNTYYDFLGEYSFETVMVATKKLISRKKWPPTPGEIMKQIEELKISDEDKLIAGEAWERVIEAIRRHGYLYNPQKVREALPNKALRAAEVVGLNLISHKGGDSYIMNTYLKVYNNLEDKNRKYEMLPKSMRKEVKQLSDKFKDKRNTILIENKEE